MSSKNFQSLKQMGIEMVRLGLVVGPGGNISARDDGRAFLSPSGFALDKIGDEEWSVIDLEKERLTSGLKPTSEAEMHIRILKARPDVQFICHAHPATTIGLISGGQDLLPFTPDFVAIVDRVAYVPYVVPCGRELAVAVENAVKSGINVVALRNHGVVTIGRSANEALTRMIVVEDQAKTQLAALIAGKPQALTAAEQDGIRHLDAETYRRKLLAGQS